MQVSIILNESVVLSFVRLREINITSFLEVDEILGDWFIQTKRESNEPEN